ncbi:hypothetical protein CC1G_14804 [Coprinopsis cinerea okayama7|uniref:F-box domain-containing protein n=1 Tax=Coprinopsis cinerea (strain Okayama-7 / 130 / ATCC MYA-4618 / FGSC 9003) TaxID=240176 RepID=D6RNN2_COPC7|nr:hypothetical protein CC1G_14804 [Coprinopsis cinerea okayama7\|eukprot:XP_002910825.1 hypothetical protein CC1G_14804 [Coprinopsis cinerea okayama7\
MSKQRRDELLREIDELHLAIDLQQSALSPIRLLPLEILARIFWFATPSGMSVEYSDIRAPWNVGGVCKYWRDVVYSTPSLWTTISIDWNANIALDQKRSPYPERLSKFLELSGSQPVSITPSNYPHVAWGPPAEAPNRQAWLSSYRLLEEAALTRWSGSIRASFLSQFRKFHSNSTQTLPAITRLNGVDDQFFADLTMEGNIKLRLPALSHVVFQDVWNIRSELDSEYRRTVYQHANSFLKEHSRTLRTLEFRGTHSLAAFAFMAKSPSSNAILRRVDKLVIRHQSRPDAVSIPSDELRVLGRTVHRATVPSVSHLTIINPPLHVAACLRRMAIPTLKTLELVIAPTKVSEEVVAPTLLDFFEASDCRRNLESLFLS